MKPKIEPIKFILVISLLLVAVSPKSAWSDPPLNESTGVSSVYWCPMRGKPCQRTDHASSGTCPGCGMALIEKSQLQAQFTEIESKQKTLGVILYPGFELLDAFGPIEMWGYVGEFKIVLVSEQAGRVNSILGVPTITEHSFETCPKLDILMVPGGMGTLRQLENRPLLDFIKARHQEAEITTSVCSGSWLLAQAGILDGRKATSNKLYLDAAVKQNPQVQWVKKARWVDDGNVITSSGVSAGMDMALYLVKRLYGQDRATEIAGWTEYHWNQNPGHDPFAK